MIDYVFYVEKYSKEFKVDSRVHFLKFMAYYQI